MVTVVTAGDATAARNPINRAAGVSDDGRRFNEEVMEDTFLWLLHNKSTLEVFQCETAATGNFALALAVS